MKATSQAKLDIEHAASEAIRAVASAASETARIIAQAAGEATKVVAVNAAENAKISFVKNSEDHDTITALVVSVKNLDTKFDEKFKDLKSDIQLITSGTATQLAGQEIRINTLEKKDGNKAILLSIGIGMLTLLSSLIIFHMTR